VGLQATGVGVACLLMVACASRSASWTLTPEGAHVHESDGSGLESCQYLGDFIGSRRAGQWGANYVLNRAAASGATTIVWDRKSDACDRKGDSRQADIVASAYKCP
jgi:hypothetical protein